MKYLALTLLVVGLLMLWGAYRLFFGQGDQPVVGMWLAIMGFPAVGAAVLWLLVLAFDSI